MIMGKLKDNVMDFKPIDARLAYVRLKEKLYNKCIYTHWNGRNGNEKRYEWINLI